MVSGMIKRIFASLDGKPSFWYGIDLAMTTPKKVSIVTLGCAKNQADTDNLRAMLEKRGHDVGVDAADADAIVVHTCSFIEAAKRESLEAIMEASKAKRDGKQLIVTGCMVQQHGKELLAELPEVSAFLGTGQLGQVPDLLTAPRERFLDRANPGGLMDPDADAVRAVKGPTAYLRLSEGCSHPCSFCVIPRLRGGVKSRTEEAILAEAWKLARQGVEELVVIGQDTGDWGRDLADGRALPRLLRRLREVSGVRWIRLMYMHPFSFSDELIDVFAESPEMFPYLDMPLQHIDDRMLNVMKRKLGEKETRGHVERIRARLPDLSFRTTFIVGFPGETDAEFDRLHAFVKEGYFDYLGAFAYSQEEGTPAGLMKDQLPEDVKKARQEAISEAYFDVAHAKAQKRLGGVETVVIESEEGSDVFARSRREAPEIDAIIRLPASAARQGRFVSARLTGYDSFEFAAVPA
jgi:ribosomal protein S12 methylthiotransferase